MSVSNVIPPVITVTLETEQDVMIADDAARRLADLLGFYPVHQAIASGLSHALCELLIRTCQTHLLQMNGIETAGRTGLQISCEVPWLADKPGEIVIEALKRKMDGLSDEVCFEEGATPVIRLTLWLTKDRRPFRHGAASPVSPVAATL